MPQARCWTPVLWTGWSGLRWTARAAGRAISPSEPLALARTALEGSREVRPGEPHVVVGRVTGAEGRTVHTAPALFGPDVLARSRGTWLAVRS